MTKTSKAAIEMMGEDPPSDNEGRRVSKKDSWAVDDEDETSNTGSYSESSGSGNHLLDRQYRNIEKTTKRTKIVALLVLLVGTAASAGFLYMGLTNAKKDQEESFDRAAADFSKSITAAWNDYESTTLWIHETCRNFRTNGFSLDDFTALHQYIVSGGLQFYGMQWIPHVSHDERPVYEEGGKEMWGELEGANYTGFTGWEPDPDNPGDIKLGPRSEQPFYFPIHFGAPIKDMVSVAHYDLWSAPWDEPAMSQALTSWKPALTGSFRLIQHSETDGFSVVLYNPGTPLPAPFEDVRPKDLSAMVIYVPDLMKRAAAATSASLQAFLYDATMTKEDGSPPQYLSGLEIQTSEGNNGTATGTVIPETAFADLQTHDNLVFEKEMAIGGKVWKLVVIPAEGAYHSNPAYIWVSGIMIFVASLLLAVWMLHNMYRTIEMHMVVTKAAAEANIVSNLFPAAVRERMIQDASPESFAAKDGFKNDGTSPHTSSALSSDAIFGSKPIAQLHPYTTVMCSDIVGFQAWASIRDPSQVFTLLETIFHAWDNIAKRRRVYKVETVADSYVAAAGLPHARSDHAVVMCRTAVECIHRMLKLCKVLERTLGPDTGELGCRIGVHSGQVVAGVLRGDKGRFQLFGDTMLVADSILATGLTNEVHVSPETAELVKKAQRDKWLVPRENLVSFMGKIPQQTYLVQIRTESRGSMAKEEAQAGLLSGNVDLGKRERLIEWNVEVLSGLLRSIMARRAAMDHQNQERALPTGKGLPKSRMVLDEVAEIIALPKFDAETFKNEVDPDSIDLDPDVVHQLADLVTKIAAMYRHNPFHCFEHASHVTMSVMKMMSRIVDPEKVAAQHEMNAKGKRKSMRKELHDHTFGITSDPLSLFACAFSAMIHDVDHQGVPNTVLIEEESPLAARYQNKSVAEQNSVDLAWNLLMKRDYDKLRACLCSSEDDFARFRSLVVNCVMATDIMDKQLGAARKDRWNKAFSGDDAAAQESAELQVNRKATIIIEHLIQASDISHTMQHWHVYAKWNERLFMEMYKAYKAGRLEKDPSVGWYRGEIGFFDFYIIPLANKLFKCGVFGVSSDEFLNYALANRKEWEASGEEMVKRYLATYAEESGSVNETRFMAEVEV
ncbi:cyclase soluble subunit alpha-3 [Seminavis robusta]|uniref:Phosphodiesterase n=1 Tax=Seminavis robusta TaxID=568900 RepID=A0A9N8H550_9STRA|nr:cyclase soluble subunit alpha-3 [Seminavis robusta]|eukprot:Sro18_g012740.1 cyclase soluble subunit alpha-3 (1125) ;mRNA; r:38810-43589